MTRTCFCAATRATRERYGGEDEPPTGGDSEWPDVDDLRTTSSAVRRTYGKSPEETR